MNDPTNDDETFEARASGTLDALMERIEDQIGDVADVDLEGGVLTIELDDGGQYVINRHAPNRQIWVSSPQSGAGHFDFHAASARWRNSRDRRDLHQLLADELGAATGRTLSLD